MSPQGPRHLYRTYLVGEILRKAFSKKEAVITQGPIRRTKDSEPEPDVFVVPASEFSDRALPANALLVVEVSDSTLRFDRGRKARLYAKLGIVDYWVVNLKGRTLEVFRDPARDADDSIGWKYSNVVVYRRGERVRPLAAKRYVQVSDIFR
jgi:Uma2 family endonuclease